MHLVMSRLSTLTLCH